jgi:hypothetical protein
MSIHDRCTLNFLYGNKIEGMTIISMRGLAATARPCGLDDDQLQEEYKHLSAECQRFGHSMNLLMWMRNRLRARLASFSQWDRLSLPPLDVLISGKVTSYFSGSVRFYLTMFHQSVRSVLSTYFDKALFDVGGHHFEWTRGPDSLELDGLEYVVPNAECPLTVSCVLYPDFPIPYYVVPDHLRDIVGASTSFLAAIIRSIIKYCASKSLFAGRDIICDDALQAGLGVAHVPHDQLPILLNSVLVPIQPISLSFVLQPNAPRYNVRVLLPDFSQLSPLPPFVNIELNNLLTEFAEVKESCDFFSAVARNPCEALEAEIAGYCTEIEVLEEREGAGPTSIVDGMNPAKRSSAFFWQPWVADYIPRFLEENKMIHHRYTSAKKK